MQLGREEAVKIFSADLCVCAIECVEEDCVACCGTGPGDTVVQLLCKGNFSAGSDGEERIVWLLLFSVYALFGWSGSRSSCHAALLLLRDGGGSAILPSCQLRDCEMMSSKDMSALRMASRVGWLKEVESAGQADSCVAAGWLGVTCAVSIEEVLVGLVEEEVFTFVVIGSSLTGWEAGRLMEEEEEKGADKNWSGWS